jgi:hypothetical protein
VERNCDGFLFGRRREDDMEQEYLYIIGVGSTEDWEARRGSFYYIEDRNGEKAMPVFTTAEKVEKHIDANFNTPKAHMDMLESIPESHLETLTEGRYIIMPLDTEGVAQVAATIGADYLIRDPRPGDEQEILRFS